MATTIFREDFDDVGSSAWTLVNHSNPLGTTSWFQGDPGYFSAQAGASNSYIAADFTSTGDTGNIYNWLISPVLTINNGDAISFYTRTVENSEYPDRLELRLSTSAESTDVGLSDTSVGDFDTLLLSVNPLLEVGGYPEGWTLFTVTIDGLSESTLGRFAFLYDVPSGGWEGGLSYYIGIDSFTLDSVPEPKTVYLLISFVLLAIMWTNKSFFHRTISLM